MLERELMDTSGNGRESLTHDVPQAPTSIAASTIPADIAPWRRVTLPRLPQITWQGSANDCGPHSLAMASSCVLPAGATPDRSANALRFARVPRLGATLPMGIPLAAGRIGLRARAGILGSLSDLRIAVDAGPPVIVLVHPTDFTSRWFDLHFRVVVGYEVDDTERMTRVLLACSATQHSGGRGWNVDLSVAAFQAQWHTLFLPRWYAVIRPITGTQSH